jgi:hypothetical protein
VGWKSAWCFSTIFAAVGIPDRSIEAQATAGLI